MNDNPRAGSISRSARGLFARLQNLRTTNYPDAPALAVRDPWPGDPSRGARLIKGEFGLLGALRTLPAAAFTSQTGPAIMRAFVHGFTWLRDLRALGTDAARARARALVSEFMDTNDLDPIASRADVCGARIAAWLGHYDFFAASADDDFRQRLMSRLVTDARNLAAALPAEEHDARALTALKGLIAAAVAMPDHAAYITRALKFLPQEISHQVLPDGCHIERSPAAHLAALQDLTEIRALLQIGKVESPASLPAAIERMALALRVLRHGDGGLTMFNGTREDLPSLIDLVLSQAGRSGRAPGSLGDSGFQRLAAGKSVLIVDAGAPAGAGADRFAHAGTLAFEFSAGKERLIVNCGAAPASGPEWRDALRATAAHSTLIIAGVSSSEIRENGLGRRPTHVNAQRQAAGGAHWLEASHDGWGKLFGESSPRAEQCPASAQIAAFGCRLHTPCLSSRACRSCSAREWGPLSLRKIRMVFSSSPSLFHRCASSLPGVLVQNCQHAISSGCVFIHLACGKAQRISHPPVAERGAR